MSTLVDDPRWIEHRDAHIQACKGLSAPPGAHERYRNSLPPYVEYLAEHIDALLANGDTHPRMRELMMEGLADNGIPLGVIFAGFRATEEEAAYVTNRPPIVEEPIDELERLRSMPYRAYLRTEHWQQVRSDALKRAEHRCQLCSREDSLQVHHRDYKRRGCERNADVFVLCAVCHEEFHDRLKAAA